MFVVVTLPNCAFHRSDADPSEYTMSRDGRRSVPTYPITPRFVVVVYVPVALVHVRFVIVPFDNVPFVSMPFVAKKFVVVAFVDVTFVKTPVDGVIAPMVVPLIDPPVTVMFWVVKLLMVPFNALMAVPEAVAKPSQLVLVPLVKERFVIPPFVVNRFVVVTDVPVAEVNVIPWSEVMPSTVNVDVTVEEDARNPP